MVWGRKSAVERLADVCRSPGFNPKPQSPEQSREHRPGFGVRGEAYLGVAVDVHAVVSIDAFRTDNLTVSLQGLQLEKFSGRQKLESIKRDC